MKNTFRQQEVLLMTGTSFSCRELPKKGSDHYYGPISKKEQLKMACWDGLIPQMLPECFENYYDSTLQLWEMNEANAFIDLEYGEFIPSIDKRSSVNPYVFLTVQTFN